MMQGILIVDKPTDWTSFDVIAKLRGILDTRKLGHSGTLDPMATGVLPVFVGQATRAVSFAESGSKEYVAGLHLGCVTNTQDTSGEVLEQHPVSVTRQELEALLPRFTGELMQVPPMYSAIKINGQKLYELSHDVKTALKKSLLPVSTVFEGMGFTYMGPVDGHDVRGLTDMLRAAKELNRPVLLHVHTKKGKGYAPAEQEPEKFHGVSPFDPATGKSAPPSPSFSSVFGSELASLASSDRRICAITAAMADGTGLTAFARNHPRRFFDVGIAEGHAVAMAAGMAKQGMLPVFAVYDSFLQRGYDMLVQDVSLDSLHVVLAVDRTGLVGADGETHHGCIDYLSQIPGMTVFCPASFSELRHMLRAALYDCKGPAAIRYPRGGEGAYREDCGDAAVSVLRQGTDACIVTYGVLVNQALEAAQRLANEGVAVRVVKLNRVAPLEWDAVCGALDGASRLVVLEDQLRQGCVGQRLAAALLERNAAPERLRLLNAGERLPAQGSVQQLYHALGLDAAGVTAAVREVLA